MAVTAQPDVAAFCREIESYLCRKNDGHLIRIVGPAFVHVCGWAQRGVPLRVAFSGIDRYFERYYAKGPRRRPVRIEFCEADVLDAFDEWRRALGVTTAVLAADDAAGDGDTDASSQVGERKRGSLSAHVERVVARLTTARSGAPSSLEPVLDEAVRELDGIAAQAKTARGTAREALVARLEAIEGSILQSGRALVAGSALQEFEREADAELAPFRARMPRQEYDRARAACVDRLIRERLRLPTIAFGR